MAYDSEHGKLWQDIKADLDKPRAKASKFAHDAEWALGGRTVRVLVAGVLFAVVVALLAVFLNWYVAPTKPSEKKDLVLAVAQILAGTALLSGIYFTWRTLQVNREGQITERFTRAIDQLGKVDDEGNKQFEIRLGGIYALARIARESEEDHWPIMEVLTAYVRQHAPLRSERGQQGEGDAAEGESTMEDFGRESETEVPYLDPDIQAIMTVLRRRTHSYGHGEPERLDLRETNLKRADLRNVQFSQAFLHRAFLKGANLSGADLREARFTSAYLSGADLSGANLSGAVLFGARLLRANLYGADLSGADLRNALYLQQYQLDGAHGDKSTKLSSPLKSPWHWNSREP